MQKHLPARNAWLRLKRNKGALCGMSVIAAAIFIAVFAYWFSPDSSPYANRMIVEIGGEKPGFTKKFLNDFYMASPINFNIYLLTVSNAKGIAW